MNTTTLPLKYPMTCAPFRLPLLLIPLVLVCFALSPQARATCQDACLTNNNTVQGDDALLNNSGESNTAVGYQALFNNTDGGSNTATGSNALFSNTVAAFNTANGAFALYLNTTGYDNTAVGYLALESNESGRGNTATGGWALSASSGNDNTANGSTALLRLRDGSHNIALGSGAGVNLTNGNNNIDIGSEGVAHESNTIRIGRERGERMHTGTYIAGIANATVTGSPVYIDATSGQLGLLTSSERFKDGIQPMGNASEALLSLRPVTFRYKKNIDPKSAPQFGLVAEEVAKVNPYLVARDEQGKPYTVRYEAVNAMLLNEFLKEHRKVEQMQKQIEALSAGLQKVSAQLELSKAAPQTVLNDR